jgi:hypothetical protein
MSFFENGDQHVFHLEVVDLRDLTAILVFPKPPPKKTVHKRAAKLRLSHGFIVMGQTNTMFRAMEGLFNKTALLRGEI